MGEKTINLERISPVDLFGLKEEKLKILRKAFPKLKIILRGDALIIAGNDDEIEILEQKLNRIFQHYNHYNKITEDNIKEIVADESGEIKPEVVGNDMSHLLVHGRNGMLIKARTTNQKRMVDSFKNNDMIFAIGPAGTGKTYTAVAIAVRALKNKEVKRIILTRPAVEAGENLGFLPGDLKDKLEPYLQPLYDALRDMIPMPKLTSYLEDGTIEIAPLAFMRGRTLDNAFAILDEAQNATENQLKMFLTRMGKSAKFIITGDITQIDLPKNQTSGLITSIKILKQIKGIDFIFLDERDVIRHPLVNKIIDAYEEKDKDRGAEK